MTTDEQQERRDIHRRSAHYIRWLVKHQLKAQNEWVPATSFCDQFIGDGLMVLQDLEEMGVIELTQAPHSFTYDECHIKVTGMGIMVLREGRG